MAEIRLTGINKVYPDGTHAVHDVDLHIADGEFMIMVGPSGCAKSTILRMIAGLETPTNGSIEIGGRLVNDVAPKDRDIAMVFQSYALYPHMTVRENMAFGLRLRRMPPTEIDQRVSDAARILGLEQLLDRLPKAMSGGQRQRVAMGRAIVREPQAFLMDEPLSNLDAKLRVQMRTEIAKLHQRLSTTTVYVTHDQVEAMTLGQRICILRKGVIQQVDAPFEVYQNPANIFVGGFIGSPGMNFMNGHLLIHDGMVYLQLGNRHFPLPAAVTSRLQATTDIHGRGVVVGIRPEHLDVASEGDPRAMPVRVELTEAMGVETYAYFTADVTCPDLTMLSDTQATSETFIARLAACMTAQGGQSMWLRPDLEEVHLFDPQSMRTMLAPAVEADVRARQLHHTNAKGAAMANVAHPAVASPLPVQPVQPVVHLHQTFVQPDVIHETVRESSPAAIESVFDQPVASPIGLEPLIPQAATGTHAVPSLAHPRPSFAGQVAAGTSLDPTRPSAPMSGSAERHERAAAAAPASADALPAAVSPPSDVAGTAPPTPVAPRGFAARVIGPAAVAPPSDPAAAGAPELVLQVRDGDLDVALDALAAADPASAEAPAARQFESLQQSTPIERSSGFREALERIRNPGGASPTPPQLHPPLGTTPSDGSLRHPTVQPAPLVVRPPQISGPSGDPSPN